MEMTAGNRKGFVYTLEAVIASTLFLTTALVVVPGLRNTEPTRAVQDNVHSSLSSLDSTGDLRDNYSAEAIESDLDEFIPPGFNYSVGVLRVETESGNVTVPEEYYYNKSGGHAELQLWIESADNLNVSFDGEKIVKLRSSAGYERKTVSGTEGFLNFSGSGELDFEFDVYRENGSQVSNENVKNVNYLLGEEDLRQVKVKIWRK